MDKHIEILTTLLISQFQKRKNDKNAIKNIKNKSQWGKELIKFYITNTFRY